MQSQQQRLRRRRRVPVAQNPDRVTGSRRGGGRSDDEVAGARRRISIRTRNTRRSRAKRLIDALLDNSGAVPLKDGQRLEIAASGLEITRGTLYPDNSRKLVLVITAADLSAFRQGKITREEAKARIKEARY